MRRLMRSADSGVTLVELMIYAILLGLLISIVSGLLISSSLTERSVRSLTGTASNAQLAADAIETGIRNSTGYQLTAVNATTQFLVARVPSGSSATTITYACTAWYYSTGTGVIRTKTSSTAIAVPDATTAATWTNLANGVTPVSGSTIFGGDTSQLTIAYKGKSGNGFPVSVNTSAVRRTEEWTTTPCF